MPLDREAVWDIWAPDEAWWSPWAKPVLFAHLGGDDHLRRVPLDWQSRDVGHLPAGSDRTALVVDLDGVQSVRYAVALAKRGFRPVPLFNTCPGPSAIVPVEGLQTALILAADDLAEIHLDPAAPPAFLLDAGRLNDSGRVRPGQFDNRWMTFPQDFPSGGLLRSRDIEMAVLLQDGGRVGDDLAHVLLEWKDAGVRLGIQGRSPGKAMPLALSRPRGYRALWHRALAALGLRRNSTGGFGSLVPEPAPEGGYGIG